MQICKYTWSPGHMTALFYICKKKVGDILGDFAYKNYFSGSGLCVTPHSCNSGRTAVGGATLQEKVSNPRRFILAFLQIYCAFMY